MIASLTCLILCAEKTLFRNHAGSRTNATLSLLETNLTREDRRELRDQRSQSSGPLSTTRQPELSQSKNWRSSSERCGLAAATLKVTPRPGRSQTSMKPFLTIGLGRPSTMSYHQSGWPNGYSKAM